MVTVLRESYSRKGGLQRNEERGIYRIFITTNCIRETGCITKVITSYKSLTKPK